MRADKEEERGADVSPLFRRCLVVLAVGGMLVAACSKSTTPVVDLPPESRSTMTQSDAPVAAMVDIPAANMKGTKSVAGAKTADLEADTEDGVNYFSPTVLTGTPGQEIKLTVENHSKTVEHNFTLEDQGLNVDLEPGANETVTITFPESGVLEFHCEYHVSSGMMGALNVA